MNAIARSACVACRGAGTALLLGLTGHVAAQGSDPGEVLYQQKVSATSGGFGGTLENRDFFGAALEPIGDLDGDGIQEVVVGAPGDDDGATNGGAIWILFMDRDGTVQSHQKVSSTVGGFGGSLDFDDRFGTSIASLGDLDGDGVVDLAVGAPGDDDGGSDSGAVWILFLDADGTVQSQQKISALAGGFTGTLDVGDEWGAGLAALDDLDGDGVTDLAVGAFRDDDGFFDAGALWILFLDADGTVDAHSKISSTSGGLTPLNTRAFFGTALASLGDLDGIGASVEALAVGAPGDVVQLGKVWILFLSSAGAVLSDLSITEGSAGFSGNLDLGDNFGYALDNLGASATPGNLDLAVGVPGDDDDGQDKGAVWILSLDPAAAIDAEQKLSALAGNLDGPLDQEGRFGHALAALDDLDLDGRMDLAVGAQADDDGGTEVGSARMLFLNDGTLELGPGATSWTGAIDRDWATAGNWTNGVPDSGKSAVISQQTNQPLVSDASQACLAAFLLPGAELELDDTFTVYGGATLHGTVSGTGELHTGASGVFAGRGTVALQTVLDHDVTVQGGPLTVAAHLDVHEDLTIRDGGELAVTGTATLDPATSATLAGDGTLDVEGDVLLAMAVTGAFRLELAGDLDVDGSVFDPTSGTVAFDGSTPQTVTQSGGAIPLALADLELDSGAEVEFPGELLVRGDALWNGTGDVADDAIFEGEFVGEEPGAEAITGGGFSFEGPFITYRGVLDPTGVVNMDSSGGDITVDVSGTILGDVEVLGGGTITVSGSELSIAGSLTLVDGRLTSSVELELSVQDLIVESAGHFDVDGQHIAVLGDPPITVRGELSVSAGGELALTACAVVVESGGKLTAGGNQSASAAIIENAPGGGGYSLQVQSHATLEAKFFVLRSPGPLGLEIDANSELTLRDGVFDLVDSAPGSVLLSISRTGPTELSNLRFEDSDGIVSGTSNLRVGAGSARLTFKNWSGSFAGPAFEDDPSGLSDWGTNLSFFHVQERAAENVLRWRSVREGDAVKFVLDKAIGAGAFGLLTEVNLGGPQIYEFADAAIVSGIAYRYRLSERFQSGSLQVLGTWQTNGQRNPPLRSRAPLGPPSLPLTAGGSGPVASPWGTFGTIQEALDARPGGESFAGLQLEPGAYAAFELREQGVRIAALDEGTVLIEGAVRIVGLAAGQSVELVGLVLDSGPYGEPALSIEASRGTVLLDGVEVRGSLHGVNVSGLVAQHTRIADLDLRLGSRALVLGGELDAARLVSGARLESWGLAAPARSGPTRADSSSRWIQHAESLPELALTSHPGRELVARLRAPAGARWTVLVSERLGTAAGLSSLLASSPLGRPGSAVSTWSTAAELDLRLPPQLAGSPLYLQALVHEPERGRLRFSNVQSTLVQP